MSVVKSNKLTPKMLKLFQEIYDTVPILPTALVEIIMKFAWFELEGIFVRSFKRPLGKPNQYTEGHCFEMVTDGINIYVCYQNEAPIIKMNKNGELIYYIGLRDTWENMYSHDGNGNLKYPNTFAIFGQYLYVQRNDKNLIAIFDIRTGRYVKDIALPDAIKMKIYNSLIYILEIT